MPFSQSSPQFNSDIMYTFIFSSHMFFFVIFMENDSKARGQRLIFSDLSKKKDGMTCGMTFIHHL